MNYNNQPFMKKNHYLRYKYENRDYLRTEPLNVTFIENGIILPAKFSTSNPPKLWADGGVIDKNDNFVKESEIEEIFGGKYDYDKDNLDVIDEEVLYFGPFVEHWGHFICDEIERLWYVKDNPKKYKIAYCGWAFGNGPGDIYGNYLELLELFGCDKNQLINIQKPTKFKKIIIPERSFEAKKYYTNEFIQFISKIVNNTLNNNDIYCPENIYLSRTKFGNNKEHGEELLEEIFEKNGYKIMYPENLSVKEQIVYFNNSKNIIMVSGSISHNLIFSIKENTNAIIINKMELINVYQVLIDQLTKRNVYYIDAYLHLFQVLFGEGPFLLIVNKCLKKYLKFNNYKYDNNIFRKYKNIFWYLKKHHEIYKDERLKLLLKSQTINVKREKKEFKNHIKNKP